MIFNLDGVFVPRDSRSLCFMSHSDQNLFTLIQNYHAINSSLLICDDTLGGPDEVTVTIIKGIFQILALVLPYLFVFISAPRREDEILEGHDVLYAIK